MEKKRHLNIMVLPIDRRWQKSFDQLKDEIMKNKNRQKDIFWRLNFSDFMDCIFYLFEKVGINEIDNIHDINMCLKSISRGRNIHYYPPDIFGVAWCPGPGPMGGTQSRAESYFITGLTYILGVADRQSGILRLGKEEFEPLQKIYFGKLALKENEKYLPAILKVAKDLAAALHEDSYDHYAR